MRKVSVVVMAGALVAAPALAQTVSGVSTTDATGTTTTVFTVSPQTNVAAADYVKWSADALNYRIAASTLALRKAQRDDVKAFARADLDFAKRQQGALFAALSNKDRKIAKPSTSLSTKNSASIELLKKAPASAFDNLYLTQIVDASPTVWALQKGYADDGSDPTLRQVATTTVPMVEQGYTAAKGLMPAALSTNR
jgi:putative membrane protein